MTSSGKCHKCDNIAFKFHYNAYPFNGNGHDGYWHCKDHGPKDATVTTTQMDYRNKDKPLTAGMNREERRYFARTGKIRE